MHLFWLDSCFEMNVTQPAILEKLKATQLCSQDNEFSMRITMRNYAEDVLHDRHADFNKTKHRVCAGNNCACHFCLSVSGHCSN